MKRVMIDKIKNNKESILIFIVGSISLFNYFYGSLVTSYYYYLITFIISLCICFLLYFVFKIKFKAKIVAYFKVTLYTYFTIFSILFIVSRNCEVITVRTPLNGYSHYKVNQIFFTFEDVNFGRYYTLTKHSANDDLTKEYDVILHLKEPVKHIYIIESIGLIKKSNVLYDRY